ncbi:MAG: nucleoside monophosphate kinase [Candidatus Levyibacteriota bacterium]
MKIILIGIQGSGKSTQGNLLSEKFNVPYLSTGHIFRSLTKEHSKLGRYIKEVMNAGYLIPDRKTLLIVSTYLKRDEYQKGYILDGFPRTLGQAKAFENHVNDVVYLNVSDKEALWRLSYRNGESRDDETLAAIRKRIHSFHKFTEPVLDFYRKKRILIEVDGEKSVGEIHKEIMEKIKKESE